ncbi:hypothetical protein Tsubulata_021491 [Turnera subulata]|uniref:Fatty acid desaturase N-terminal domain-containing protein n=1 Tax=Turnera subulata TaxID=218843 RepID=A0A9Q0F269_9ROSI|nr:hypothetical protein Tsubulata_021491 [Turnera subulata]
MEAYHKKSSAKRVPSEKPPFTLATLKKAIPAHCFHRSLLRSFSYLAYDLSVCYALFYVAKTYIPILPSPLNYVAWPIYWFIQGAFMTGIWVIGHECGHHAFSEYAGALSTIDLDFGWLNRVLHHVTNTHICHHLISTIPHYHALEATEAIKPILGDYYQIDSTPIHKMLYRAAKECIYAEPDHDSKDKGVYWYRAYKEKN